MTIKIIIENGDSVSEHKADVIEITPDGRRMSGGIACAVWVLSAFFLISWGED